MLKWGKNRAIPPSFLAVTPRDIATPPVHFLWKNRLTHTIQTTYEIIKKLIVKSFDGLKP